MIRFLLSFTCHYGVKGICFRHKDNMKIIKSAILHISKTALFMVRYVVITCKCTNLYAVMTLPLRCNCFPFTA